MKRGYLLWAVSLISGGSDTSREAGHNNLIGCSGIIRRS